MGTISYKQNGFAILEVLKKYTDETHLLDFAITRTTET